jgi:hypothetical protein
MQKYGLIQAKMVYYHADDVARPGQPRFAMSHDAATLELAVVKPAIHKSKILAAVINLPVFEPNGLATLQNGNMLGSSVPYPRQILCQMDGGTRFVTDAEQEHLCIQFIYPTHRTVEAMRRVNGVGRCDPAGQRADRGEGVRTVATEDSRTPPERFRNDSHVRTRSRLGIKWVIVVPGHARHNQHAPWSQNVVQGRNQSPRAILDGPDLRERGMHQQDGTGLYAKTQQLLKEE